MIEKWEGKPSHSLMESKELLVSIINNLTNTLDSIGFYVYNYDMIIDSPKQLNDLDELRTASINRQAVVKFNLDAFISNKIWNDFSEKETDFFGIEIIPIADLFKFEQDAHEEE